MRKTLFTCFLILFSINCYANDKKPVNESTVFNETFSWQAQAGFSINHANSIIDGIEQRHPENYLNLYILLDFYYKGFFIQSDHRRADTLNLGSEIGYQLFVEDDWELDIISKSYIGGFNSDDIIEWADEEIPILEGLKNRGSADGIGIRYSRYFEDSIFSFDIATLSPFSDVNGWVLDAFYSHIMPYRNWDIYLNTSLTYYSEKVTDYYVGIAPDEVSALRHEFTASHAVKTQFELFAQRPISESWTVNIGLSQSYYLGDLGESPIVNTENTTQIMLGVLYVF